MKVYSTVYNVYYDDLDIALLCNTALDRCETRAAELTLMKVLQDDLREADITSRLHLPL